MNKIIAIDFDGTLCTNSYPEIGEPNREVIDYVKYCKSNGDKLILWTCRCGEHLSAAVKWCQEHGIFFDAVNENLPEVIEQFGGDCRKIFANVYIDDQHLSLREVCGYIYDIEDSWEPVSSANLNDDPIVKEMFTHKQAESLYKLVGHNGEKFYMDIHRTIAFDKVTGQSYRSSLADRIANEICPIEFPYNRFTKLIMYQEVYPIGETSLENFKGKENLLIYIKNIVSYLDDVFPVGRYFIKNDRNEIEELSEDMYNMIVSDWLKSDSCES